MAMLQVSDAMLEKLERYSRAENKPVEIILEEMIERYPEDETIRVSEKLPIEALFGFIDADIDDLSERTSEELHAIFKDKYLNSD